MQNNNPNLTKSLRAYHESVIIMKNKLKHKNLTISDLNTKTPFRINTNNNTIFNYINFRLNLILIKMIFKKHTKNDSPLTTSV